MALVRLKWRISGLLSSGGWRVGCCIGRAGLLSVRGDEELRVRLKAAEYVYNLTKDCRKKKEEPLRSLWLPRSTYPSCSRL